MKIGILTQPLYCNYGGIVQCYALQTVLQRMGQNTVILPGVRLENWNIMEHTLHEIYREG